MHDEHKVHDARVNFLRTYRLKAGEGTLLEGSVRMQSTSEINIDIDLVVEVGEASLQQWSTIGFIALTREVSFSKKVSNFIPTVSYISVGCIIKLKWIFLSAISEHLFQK